MMSPIYDSLARSENFRYFIANAALTAIGKAIDRKKAPVTPACAQANMLQGGDEIQAK
jgi:hypothetical protein